MGEWRYGAAAGTQDAIYLTLSTGLGGAAIIDGRPLVGTSGTAGEFGHITVELDGPRCGCGGMGHVESIASGTALANLGRALVEDQPDSPLARLAADGAEIDARLVTLAAEQGDAGAAALLDRAWVAFGALCASLVNALDPEVIVIGGSIAEHHQRPLFDQIAVEMERRAFPILLDKVRIVPAALGGGRLPDRLAADRQRAHRRPRLRDRVDPVTARSFDFVTTRIGINGFGRIGRQTLKAMLERHPDELEVVAVNDLADDETNAHLFKYDSTYGRFAGEVRAGDSAIVVDGREIRSFSERDPAALPWGDLGVDIVVESTGIFTDATKASAHRDAGARKVIISAPGEERGRHDRPRRQRGPIRPGAAPHRQQRQLHDERARSAGQGHLRHVRDRARADDDGPQLHERPERARRVPQGPPPRPQRRSEHHPDDDGRGEGAGPRDPGAEGQVRRLLAARADPDGLGHRLRRGHRAAGDAPNRRTTPCVRLPTDR